MKGRIIVRSFRRRQIVIYLPAACPGDGTGFSVVYMQDGGDLFLPSPSYSEPLERLEEMVRQGEMAPLILAGVESKDRLAEYTPWPASPLIPGKADFGGRGGEYLRFLAEELKPWIDREYPTRPAMENTGIAGASLGGLIALYAAYLYPDVFGRIGSISGSMWYPGFLDFMAGPPLPVRRQRIHLDVGGLEGVAKTTVQWEMVPANQKAYQILRDKGFGEAGCRLVIEPGAVHGLPFFRNRLPDALRWLFDAGTFGADLPVHEA